MRKDEKELEDFENILKKSKNFKVVKIGAEWCGPCLRLKPYFNKSKEENTDVDFHDIDLGNPYDQKNSMIARKYKVQGIPYVVLLSPENEVIKRAVDTFNFMDEFSSYINKEL